MLTQTACQPLYGKLSDLAGRKVSPSSVAYVPQVGLTYTPLQFVLFSSIAVRCSHFILGPRVDALDRSSLSVPCFAGWRRFVLPFSGLSSFRSIGVRDLISPCKVCQLVSQSSRLISCSYSLQKFSIYLLHSPPISPCSHKRDRPISRVASLLCLRVSNSNDLTASSLSILLERFYSSHGQLACCSAWRWWCRQNGVGSSGACLSISSFTGLC